MYSRSSIFYTDLFICATVYTTYANSGTDKILANQITTIFLIKFYPLKPGLDVYPFC
jgi:hypothetical protein